MQKKLSMRSGTPGNKNIFALKPHTKILTLLGYFSLTK
jgi:hypothetical protein